MTIRLSIRSLAGTERTLVAVGTARLAVMLVTVRAAAPRSLLTSAPAEAGGGGDCATGAPGAAARGDGRRGGRPGVRDDGLGTGAVAVAVVQRRLVVGEETPPRPVDRAGVGLVALVK